MERLTIGAFARATRLSPKALRLYDELGLLPPARVDPETGYRYYAPEQRERARLVAWLRRIGMPLARIREVCAQEPRAAAGEVRAYWAQVEAETAARRDLVTLLIDHLAGKDHDNMTHSDHDSHSSHSSHNSHSSHGSHGGHEGDDGHGGSPREAAPGPRTPLTLRHAALTDPGRVRGSNQDAVHAGPRLLAVADGYGSGGARAAAAAIEALLPLEAGPQPPRELLGVLDEALARAAHAVRTAQSPHGPHAPNGPNGAGGKPGGGTPGEEAGTTLTALLFTGARQALIHIGDTRALLLRAGELSQLTHDHTLVQSLVDQGRLDPAEAATHPQRAVLERALGVGDGVPDVRLHDAEPGDRYLLCSDGLSSVVPQEEIRRVLLTAAGPERTALELIALANRAGGPDNVSCVVADVLADSDD
ncbi:MerR family transcriptional regulator [Streptomyces sp. NBC_01775]|uniref:MerR family transcriptional regulator n=1 Tax=Streptomyces sp. NBC_01775 TaxID=2975939 RepID=UPI002DD83141|nr:MerR family transcriptional regulator [Streptomyces sp. NBC_01775]WSB81791.1 MerR family transcriptional regulator [Streptomyces sp. NBC_01775]